MDKLRILEVKNFNAPIGTPIRFDGENIGRVTRNDGKGNCEIAINSDFANRLLNDEHYGFSLEVTRNDKWVQV